MNIHRTPQELQATIDQLKLEIDQLKASKGFVPVPPPVDEKSPENASVSAQSKKEVAKPVSRIGQGTKKQMDVWDELKKYKTQY